MQSKNRQKLLNATQNTSPTLRRPYPTTVSHQQFQVGSHNTPYTAKHSIQTHHRDTQSTNSQKPLNTTQRQAAILYCDPTQLLFQINNAEQRSGQTTHHTATRSIQTRKRTSETRSQGSSQHHTKKPDILFWDPTQLLFPINSSEHRSGHTTHHIQPNIASKHATETRSQRTARSLSTPRKTPGILFRDPYPSTVSTPHGPGSAATLPQ